MTRFTLNDDGRMVAHGPLGERDLSPDEAERVRDALESPRLPWWLEYGAVALGVAAMLILARGGGI